jgi:hypothetical protein
MRLKMFWQNVFPNKIQMKCAEVKHRHTLRTAKLTAESEVFVYGK